MAHPRILGKAESRKRRADPLRPPRRPGGARPCRDRAREVRHSREAAVSYRRVYRPGRVVVPRGDRPTGTDQSAIG